MLLIIEALLLMFAALGQDHRAAAAYPLDMATTSVDDQYLDCSKEMEHQMENEYLKQELNNGSPFGKAWELGEEKYKTLKDTDTLRKPLFIAIHVYTNYDLEVYRMFNADTRNGKDSYIGKTYKWYSLHFLLTKAIQNLHNKKNVCYTTYRGTPSEFSLQGGEIRLGAFSSSSLDQDIAKGFGNKSCFKIRTCHGADVTAFSKHPEQKEVLIPPYERFKVTDVQKRSETKDLWCETVYTLETTRTSSFLNCGKLPDFKAKL